MSADVTFEIGGVAYPFVLPDDMTYAEQRELKRLSGGMSPGAVFEHMQGFDPDAWNALMLVCMRRVDPKVKDNALDNVTPMPIAIKVLSAHGEASAAEVEEDPPTVVSAPAAEVVTEVVDRLPEASPRALTRDAFGALV